MKRWVAILVLVSIVITGFSGAASASDYTVWHQATTYGYNVYLNSSVGEYRESTGYTDNWISMNVHIRCVSENLGMQYVTIDVSVMGYSNATILQQTLGITEMRPYEVVIKATQENVPDSLYIHFHAAHNSGVNVTGDKYKGNTVDDPLRDTAKFAAEFLIGHIKYLSYLYDAYSVARFIYDELSPEGVKDKQGCVGNGSAWESFEVENNVVWDSSDSLGTYGHITYVASTQILWEIPSDDSNTYTLHLSAQNIIGTWADNLLVDIDNGASTGVTITIKDGHITSFNAQTENVDGTVTTTFYTKDYTPSWVNGEDNYYVSPTLRVSAVTVNNVPVNYKVDWGDGAESKKSNVASGQSYAFTHKYQPHIPEGNVKTYTITVWAFTDDYYGGWSETKTIEITVHNNGKMDGGGGGGGCPFLYTYSSDSWREENNVLVWAENATRPFLNTVDSYLFEANETNGNVILGIGEPGEDVDFVDAIKLYRVYAPPGYNMAESYGGMIYAYRDVESGIARDSSGENITSLISGEDDNYWVGDKGEYIDVTLNLSEENLLVLRGIDNPPVKVRALTYRPPTTQSTIWLYANVSGEWVKLGEIKVRHSMHTNVINLDALSWLFGDKVELRFEMRDRNGIDFIGVAHDYRVASVESVPLIEASYGYENISKVDGYYLCINPGDFVRLNFEGKGDGLYLLKIYGFYFNRNMIGKGIGIASADEVNIAEAELQESIEPGKYYVLLPLLEDYSGICHIAWYVDGMYVPGSKPVVSFETGEHEIELYIYRYDGSVDYYSLSIS